MARKSKLKKWFVSMLSGVIVTTTVMGTSVVAFAVDDNQQQLEENQNGQGDNNAPDTENQDQEQDAATSYSSVDVPQQETTAEPKVTEVIVESGNGLVITTNPDSSQTASYDKEVSGMLTPESTQAVVDEKTAEQENIKSDIEGQGGSYSYEISQDETFVLVKKELAAESKEDAEQKAEEFNGEIKTTEVKPDKPMTKIFDTEEDAQAEVDSMNASGNYKDAKIVETSEAPLTEQRDFEGYYIDENGERVDSEYSFNGYHIEEIESEQGEYATFKIVITGGVDTINIDLVSLPVTGVSGDMTIYFKYIIVNESGDDYEFTEYNTSIDNLYKLVSTSKYNANPEKYGEKVDKYSNEKRVAYIPNDIRMTDGRNRIADELARTNLAMAYYYTWKEAGSDENVPYDTMSYKTRKEWAQREGNKNITQEDLLEFYNEVLGTNYDNVVDAWLGYLKSDIYQPGFMMNDPDYEYDYWEFWYDHKGEDKNGSEFFKDVDFSADSEEQSFVLGHHFSGPLMDNLYLSSRFTIFNEIKIEALRKISAVIDYTKIEYSVVYEDEAEGYVVTIIGNGSVPAPNPGPGPDPTPDPTPVPTPVVTTPGEAPAVLGAQRELPGEAPAVLGARRAGTSDETNMVLRLIVIAAAASVLVIARKRAHN